jgi:hemoglobin
MKRVLSICLMLLVTTSVVAHHDEKAAPSLYKRLGGYDAIAAVVDDFLGRMASDPKLGRFFTGLSTNSKMRVRQLIVEQLCAATGGPCVYVGRDMKSAHAGAGISEADWDIAVKHLLATFDRFKVPEKERSEVIAAIASMKGDIVEKK